MTTRAPICTGGIGRHLPLHPIRECEHVVTDNGVAVYRCPTCGSFREREVSDGD